MQLLVDGTTRLLAEMIQATALRHHVLASNVANVETPGFQAQEVSFQRMLGDAATLPTARERVQAAVVPDPEAVPRRDGNSVDLDRQMVKLSQNAGWHMAMLQMLNSRFNLIKTAMRDRL
jgi:flagellar basal-body rod protein FlgB